MNHTIGFFRRYLILIMMMLTVIALLGYYYFRHRRPYTPNAFVVANARPVSVLVPGYLTNVYVVNNQTVKQGDKLFTIFRPPYELTVTKLEATIRAITAEIIMAQAATAAAQAKVTAGQAKSDNARYLAQRSHEMYAGEAISQNENEIRQRTAEAARAELAAEERALIAAQAQVEVLIHRKAALIQELELAKIYLEQTELYALSDGIVTNMFVAPGGYYHAGDTLCAFIDTSSWSIQANFEETDLANIQIGDKAKIWLWQYPGRVFHGRVQAIDWGVERRLTSNLNGAAIVEKENQWFLLPQRFPVQISIDDADAATPLHLGGSAYVELEISAELIRQIVWRIYQW